MKTEKIQSVAKPPRYCKEIQLRQDGRVRAIVRDTYRLQFFQFSRQTTQFEIVFDEIVGGIFRGRTSRLRKAHTIADKCIEDLYLYGDMPKVITSGVNISKDRLQ